MRLVITALAAALVAGCSAELPALTAGDEACSTIEAQAVYRSCELPEVVLTGDVLDCLEVAGDRHAWRCEIRGGLACPEGECADDPACVCFIVQQSGPYIVEGWIDP